MQNTGNLKIPQAGLGLRSKAEIRIQQEAHTWYNNKFRHLNKLFYCNHNNPKNRIEGAILRTIGLTAGVSDTTLLHKGKVYFIEFKTPEGVQSQSQKDWQKAVEAAGFYYTIVKSVDEFKKIVYEVFES